MLVFITLLFFNTYSYSTITVDNLCGNSNPQSMLTSPFAKTSKHQWCVGGVCEEDGKSFERVKCVKQMKGNEDEYHENAIMVSHDEIHTAPNQYLSKSYGAFYRLYPQDDCFEECRPEDQIFLSVSTSKKLGMEKAECRECMIKLPAKEADLYVVKGYEKTFYEGQKCFSSCRLPMGPYLDHRPYSSDCLGCLGEGIIAPAEHLSNKAGECFELKEGRYRGAVKVPEKLCKEDLDHYTTRYDKGSKFSVAYIIFGEPNKCYEVDSKSGGRYYKKSVDMMNCDPQAINTDERGNSKESSSTSPRKSSTSSAVKN